MHNFLKYLRSILSSDVGIQTQVTYVGDYESSALVLQYQRLNHPRSLECEGAERLRKCCLKGTFFGTIYLFFSRININHGGRRPHLQQVYDR